MKKYKSRYLNVKRGDDKLELLLPDCMSCNVVLMHDKGNQWECPLCGQGYICALKVIRVNGKESGFCNDCGMPLDWHQTEKDIEDQVKQVENLHVRIVCRRCLGNGHVLGDDELKDIKLHSKKVKSLN